MYVLSLLGDIKGMFQPHRVATLVEDRSKWKKDVVESCYIAEGNTVSDAYLGPFLNLGLGYGSSLSSVNNFGAVHMFQASTGAKSRNRSPNRGLEKAP